MLDEIASAEEQEAWLALQDYEGVTALGPAREPIGRQYGFELSPNPLVEPVNGVSQAAGEQRNVEDVRADSLFFRSEKIEEQSKTGSSITWRSDCSAPALAPLQRSSRLPSLGDESAPL